MQPSAQLDTTLEEIKKRLRDNPLVATTDKRYANLIFSFGRDHGHYGRILSQTVVVAPTLAVRQKREVYGFCFTPQDGNRCSLRWRRPSG